MTATNDRTLSTEEAAERLHVKPWTLRKYLREGQLQGYQFATKLGWRVYENSIEDFIQAHQNKKIAAGPSSAEALCETTDG